MAQCVPQELDLVSPGQEPGFWFGSKQKLTAKEWAAKHCGLIFLSVGCTCGFEAEPGGEPFEAMKTEFCTESDFVFSVVNAYGREKEGLEDYSVTTGGRMMMDLVYEVCIPDIL